MGWHWHGNLRKVFCFSVDHFEWIISSSLASNGFCMSLQHVIIHSSVHQQVVWWQSGWIVFACVKKCLIWSYYSALALLLSANNQCEHFYLAFTVTICAHMKRRWNGAMTGCGGYAVLLGNDCQHWAPRPIWLESKAGTTLLRTRTLHVMQFFSVDTFVQK